MGGSESSRKGPDPGAYGAPTFDKTTKYKRSGSCSFGTAGRFKHGAKEAPGREPGPGAYDVHSLLDKHSITFGASQRTTFKDPPVSQKSPSPGDYTIKTDRVGNPSLQGVPYSFAGKYQSDKEKTQPGPGAYTPAFTGDWPSQPKFGFGTSTRPPLNLPTDAPAPGVYGPGPDSVAGHITLKTSPKFSLRAKIPTKYGTKYSAQMYAQASGFG